MKKVDYEVVEFNCQVVKNVYYFCYEDVLESKKYAEICYRSKVSENAMHNDSRVSYQLFLTFKDDAGTDKYMLSDPGIHLIESQILSEMTGRQIQIPEWSKRLDVMMKHY